MRVSSSLLATVLAVASVGTAFAQGEAPAISQAPGAADVVAKADAIVERLQNAVSAIQRQLDVARSERNVVKVLFLSEKLSQANASLRSAVERRASVKAALERGDGAAAAQDLEVLGVIGERGDEYLNATSQAVGEGTRMAEASSVTVTTDPGTPTVSTVSEYPATDPITGAADSNGRQSAGQVGVVSTSVTQSAPPANPAVLPNVPPTAVSVRPAGT